MECHTFCLAGTKQTFKKGMIGGIHDQYVYVVYLREFFQTFGNRFSLQLVEADLQRRCVGSEKQFDVVHVHLSVLPVAAHVHAM